MEFSGNAAKPRYHFKRDVILMWIFRHMYIDRATVQLLLTLSHSTACETLVAMEKDGLIARFQGHAVDCWMYRLTPKGGRSTEHLTGEFDQGLKAMTNPSDIGSTFARHNLVAARYGASWLARQKFEGHVLSARQVIQLSLQIGDKSASRVAYKVPDIMLLTPVPEHLREVCPFDHFKIAIEVQQSYESPATRAYKLWQYYSALERNEINELIYVSTYPRVLDTYLQQWHNDLEERVLADGNARWITPAEPRRILPDDNVLTYAQFEVLGHDPFAAGLYPPPHMFDRFGNHMVI